MKGGLNMKTGKSVIKSHEKENELFGFRKRQSVLFRQEPLHYKALMYFKDTIKNEESMYARFLKMPKEYLESLMEFYNQDELPKVFKLICRWWNVYGKKTNKKTV